MFDHIEAGCSHQQDTSVKLDWNKGTKKILVTELLFLQKLLMNRSGSNLSVKDGSLGFLCHEIFCHL